MYCLSKLCNGFSVAVLSNLMDPLDSYSNESNGFDLVFRCSKARLKVVGSSRTVRTLCFFFLSFLMSSM